MGKYQVTIMYTAGHSALERYLWNDKTCKVQTCEYLYFPIPSNPRSLLAPLSLSHFFFFCLSVPSAASLFSGIGATRLTCARFCWRYWFSLKPHNGETTPPPRQHPPLLVRRPHLFNVVSRRQARRASCTYRTPTYARALARTHGLYRLDQATHADLAATDTSKPRRTDL